MSLSGLSAQPHPTDARIKGVTLVQLQQLAATHHRTLLSEKGMDLQQDQQAPVAPTALHGPLWPEGASDFPVLIGSLVKQLGSLQAQLATLQHQLTRLCDPRHLGQERQTNQTSITEEKSLDTSSDKSLRPPKEKSLDTSSEKQATGTVIDRRSRHHVLPLVEYSTEAQYVVICPKLGLLTFEPDSAEWFAWLSTQISFRFVGVSGHLTAHRNKCSPRWTWRATRSIHSRSRSLHLVRTEFLTIAVLEQAAASLRSLLK